MAKTIDDYKKDWEVAKQAGDQKAMDAAHAGAEAIRAQQGYSGGADGSQRISLTDTGSKNTTTNKTPAPSNFTGSANNVLVNSLDQETIRQLMNSNSQAWHGADTETQAYLHDQNKYLASLLGSGVSFDAATGYWGGEADSPVQQQPQSYDSKYSTQIDQLLNSILNREEFSYDHTTDPSYLAYEQQYKRLGDRAREDTLGNVAGLTGGYASSWAVSAASQAQNDYNAQLSGKIPELYDAAYNRYLNEDSLKRNDLGLLMGVDQTEYDRYRDTVSDNQWQQQFDTSNSQWQQQFDWNKNVDEWNMSNTEATQKFDQMMSKWQLTGVADKEVASALGVPEGATTESYYFNKASMELDQAKLALDKANAAKNNTTTKVDHLADSIARNAKSLIDSTESYQEGAKYILSAVSSADEFFTVGSQAGIPNSTLQQVFDSFYDQALKDPGEEGDKDYAYYAALMGKQEDPEAWLISNKYSIPSDILEDLYKLLDY